jgi:hypothetical protein
MKFQVAIAISAAAVLLGGCSFNAAVGASPNLNVYSSYADKLPGTYLLYIDADMFDRVVKPTGINCAAHSYPLDFRDAFKQSVVQTMQQLVENVQVVDQPVAAADLTKRGARGMVVVRGEGLNPRLMFVEGFWSSTPDASVEISSSMTVDEASGRLLGTTASGQGTAQTHGGCGDGAAALGSATEAALKQLMGQLGERMSNSPRLRTTANDKTRL